MSTNNVMLTSTESDVRAYIAKQMAGIDSILAGQSGDLISVYLEEIIAARKLLPQHNQGPGSWAVGPVVLARGDWTKAPEHEVRQATRIMTDEWGMTGRNDATDENMNKALALVRERAASTRKTT